MPDLLRDRCIFNNQQYLARLTRYTRCSHRAGRSSGRVRGIDSARVRRWRGVDWRADCSRMTASDRPDIVAFLVGAEDQIAGLRIATSQTAHKFPDASRILERPWHPRSLRWFAHGDFFPYSVGVLQEARISLCVEPSFRAASIVNGGCRARPLLNGVSRSIYWGFDLSLSRTIAASDRTGKLRSFSSRASASSAARSSAVRSARFSHRTPRTRVASRIRVLPPSVMRTVR